MPVTLITGPANAGKAQVLLEAVRRHLAQGEEPLLVVPTRADVEHYLRELAARSAVLGVRVERFDGLIDELLARGAVREPTLGAAARARLLAVLARRHAADADARVGVSGGYVRALAHTLGELQARRVTPRRLRAAIEQWSAADGPQPQAELLARLYEDYRGELRRLGRVDAEQRAMRALDALRERPALWRRTPVLFYGFDDLTPLQLDAIETLGVKVDAEVTVSLTYEPGRSAFAGRAATFHALAPLAAEQRALPARADYYAPSAAPALAHLERSLFEPDAARVDARDAVRLLEGGGERSELELVAGEIKRLLRDGMVAEDIAVVVREAGVRAEVLEEVLAAAAIPFALQRRRPFADTALGGALIGLLRCVPAKTGDRPAATDAGPSGSGAGPASTGAGPAGELADLLAWLRAPGLLERPELADTLELQARRLGVLDAAGARELWERERWPLDGIDRLREAQERGPDALIDLAARELQRLYSAPRQRSAEVLSELESEQARALAVARRALAELRELARAAPELAPPDARELADALSRVDLVVGRRPAPGAVAVLDPLSLRARRVRALFLCGMQEGAFPARAHAEPFLAEQPRRRLTETAGLRLGERVDTLAAERYLLYAAVSRPEELLVLSWHVAGEDGEPAARSLFVDDVCDPFDARLEATCARPRTAVADTEAPARDAAGAHERDEPARDGPIAPLRDELLLAGLRERVWSASALEAWVACPVRWFVDRLLRAEDLEPDAEPLARGALAHAVLRDTLDGLRRETGSARVTPARLELARELLARSLREREAEHRLSLVPERALSVRRRLRAELERYLEHAAGEGSPLEPRFLELGFGFAEEEPPAGAGEHGEGSSLPAFELGGGVTMRGRIDRVDSGDRGQAVVYDYKSSFAPPSAKWLADGQLQVALYMRAVEQLLGVDAVGGFYQPLSGSDLRARGVLDEDAGLELEAVRGDGREHGEARELLDDALALALAAAAEAARGELRPRPATCGFNGSGCMYPTICRCER